MKLYDESEAVAFIKQHTGIPDLDDDTILRIVDAIYDFYDENGDLDLDFDEEDDLDVIDDPEALISYVSSATKDTDHDTIEQIVKAELDYEASLLQ